MTRSASKIKLTGYKGLFGSGVTMSDKEEITEIPLNELHEFANHPFHVVDNDEMNELVQSIKEHGVLVPGIVRRRMEGGYEIIAGHRRSHAAGLAGLETVPMIIKNCDDDVSTLLMVDTNLQRESILPSEKAHAYKMKYDAMKHQGKAGRSGDSLKEMAEETGEGWKTIQRYIWLARLSDELLEYVDQKKLGLVPGIDISFLNVKPQRWVHDYLQGHTVNVTTAQSAKLKQYGQSGELTEAMVGLILSEEKVRPRKVTIGSDRIGKYFPENYSSEEIENVIYQLLDEWKNQKQGEEVPDVGRDNEI